MWPRWGDVKEVLESSDIKSSASSSGPWVSFVQLLLDFELLEPKVCCDWLGSSPTP